MQIKYNQTLGFLLVAITTIAVGVLVGIYCDVFYNLDLLAKDRLLDNPQAIFIVTPLLFWISAYLCRRFSPNSSGISLDHVKSALEQSKRADTSQKISTFLSFRIAIFSAISSLICSFGGGALGREGPSVHIAASIFANIANKFKNKIPQINLQNWIFAGSAVGLAVAFNAPIAGLIYVVEKLVKNKYYHFKSNMLTTLLAMTIFLFFLQKDDPVFEVVDLNFAFDIQILLMFLTAVVCGILAFYFKKINSYLHDKLIAIKSNFWHLAPVVAGLLVAVISFYCGIYSFSGGIKTANDALASADILLSYKEVFGRILNTIITFISGCAGGLVAPSMTIGAGIASIIGSFFIYANIKILILTGMAAFLAVILGEPITAAIVVYEATAQPIYSLPFLILATFISISVVRLLKSYSTWRSPKS